MADSRTTGSPGEKWLRDWFDAGADRRIHLRLVKGDSASPACWRAVAFDGDVVAGMGSALDAWSAIGDLKPELRLVADG